MKPLIEHPCLPAWGGEGPPRPAAARALQARLRLCWPVIAALIVGMWVARGHLGQIHMGHFHLARLHLTHLALYWQAIAAIVIGMWGTVVHAAPVTSPISGEIQRISINNANDHWSGGTIVVGGTVVTVPRNLLIDLPANRVTLQQLYAEAPLACVSVGQTGLAKGDSCNLSGTGGFATIAATRSNAGNIIAGDVFIQKGVEAITGVVSYIDYIDGYFRMNGPPGDPSAGVMVRLNDPDSRHTVQQGLGCAGGPNCSPDPRFTLDGDNYTNVFSSGYPLCIPSTASRTFIDRLGLGTTTAQATPDGNGDVLCPQTNRNSQPVDDSRRFAPIRIGDSITAEGNFERINGVRFLSAHTTMVGLALSTKDQPGQPDYLFLDEVGIDAPGFQNQRIRTLIIGFSTLPSDVLVWSIHYDPVTNAPHEFPLASVQGCDVAGGPGTCGQQGLVAGGGGNIFKIRHDVDFLVGAKPRLNPCAHLRGDPRWSALNICPTGGSAETNMTEMMGILSPIPHEIQTRTGHLLASQLPGGVPLVTLDINGNVATNGQYLFPFGIGLGGIVTPEFVEIDLNALGTAVSFSGLPWNMDRRLSPGGCIDTTGDGVPDCESTPQPLDPFPFEGTDPRSLTANLPSGPYADPNFTAAPLTSVRDRILSFVDAASGKFNGNATVLAWPPASPPAQSIPVTPDVVLQCSADPGVNNAPVAVNDSATTGAGAPVTIAVLANDTDPDGNVLSVVSATAGTGGTVSNTATDVTFTPDLGFSGTASFSYTVSDGTATATASVSVTVAPASNVAPVANPDSASTNSGTPVTIAVLANDSDANGDPLTVTGVTTNPALGTATTNGTTVTYTPQPGTSGNQPFSYTVSDGQLSSTGNVTVTVAAAEALAVTTAEFRTSKGEWRVTGTSSVVGASVTVVIGATLDGPVLGTAAVDVTGVWTLRLRNSPLFPDASRTISIKSSGGGTRLAIPVTVRN